MGLQETGCVENVGPIQYLNTYYVLTYTKPGFHKSKKVNSVNRLCAKIRNSENLGVRN